MKKYAFFKYFIKNRFFAGGDRGGFGRPVPIEGEVGCSIFTPISFGDGAGGGCMEAGVGTEMLKPAPNPPRCHV